jgi:hypothetical protein
VIEYTDIHKKNCVTRKSYKTNCRRCDIGLTPDNKWRDEALCVICGPIIKTERDKRHAPKRRKSEKLWRERNPEKVKQYRQNEKDGKRHYKRQYGLLPEEVNRMLANGCESCGSMDELHIDHCHESGKVRGCLCRKCNVALGFAGEDSNRLRCLANYIERWKCQGKKSVK